MTILAIPADTSGGKLWIKEPRQEGDRLFVKYKSTYNDIPWRDTELFAVDDGDNLAITADNGTVMFRFPVGLMKNFE